MNKKYHIEITRSALENHFSESALQTIITANIKQDRMTYLIGHDHIHFDSEAFEQGFRYIAEQETLLLALLHKGNVKGAWQALGRSLHSWQDFFSHSNYVDLWVQRYHNQAPEAIEIDEPEIKKHPEFTSGKIYGLLEFLSMLPGLKKHVLPYMPADSHAVMNLDEPSEGENFAFAYWAAYKATIAAYEKTIQHIQEQDNSESLIIQFTDK